MERAGFREGTNRQIETGLMRALRKKIESVATVADRTSRSSFHLFSKPPIDTGKLQRGTKASAIFSDLKNSIRIRFKSSNVDDYGIFPLLGLSTSRKYGERNWLKAAAGITGKELTRGNSIFKR